MVNWYFKSFGQEFGPVSHEELKALADSGQLGPDDRIRKGDTGKWYKAKRVAGLLPGSEAIGQADDELADDSRSDDSESTAVVARTDVRRWLCEVDGRTEGPYDVEQLRAAIAAGSVGPDDRIRNSRETVWQSVAEFADEHFAEGRHLWPDRTSARSLTDTAEIAVGATITHVPDSETNDHPPISSTASPAAPMPADVETRSVAAQPPVSLSGNKPVAASSPAPPPTARSARPSLQINLPRFELAWSPARWAAVAGILLCAAVVALGFGSSASVSGQVQIDGQTLPVGQVTFKPSGGNRGRTFSISIIGGRFAATDDSLQVSGSYDVVVVVGNALGLTVQELESIPSLAELNGSRFETNIDSDGSDWFDFEFSASQAIRPVVEEQAGSPVMLQ